MTTDQALSLLQTLVIGLTMLIIAWQIYRLRIATQTDSCQDIVENFFHVIENPDFHKLFSFGPDWGQASEDDRKKAVLCATVFSFLEQLYVEASAGQLAERLSGPWVEFVRSWLNQDCMKQYWGSAAMICPTAGFDQGFQEFVTRTYKT